MQSPLAVFISHMAALALLAAALIVVHKRQVLHARYRWGVLSMLGAALGLALLFALSVLQYREAVVAWRLKQEGMTTPAHILSARKTGKTARTNMHGSQMYDVTCEYVAHRGAKLHGRIQLPDELSPTPGTTVLVRYLPSDPTVVREEYDVLTDRAVGRRRRE